MDRFLGLALLMVCKRTSRHGQSLDRQLREAQLRPAVKNAGSLARLEELIELIRQLAYGLTEEPKPEAKTAATEDGSQDRWQSWNDWWGKRQIR